MHQEVSASGPSLLFSPVWGLPFSCLILRLFRISVCFGLSSEWLQLTVHGVLHVKLFLSRVSLCKEQGKGIVLFLLISNNAPLSNIPVDGPNSYSWPEPTQSHQNCSRSSAAPPEQRGKRPTGSQTSKFIQNLDKEDNLNLTCANPRHYLRATVGQLCRCALCLAMATA